MYSPAERMISGATMPSKKMRGSRRGRKNSRQNNGSFPKPTIQLGEKTAENMDALRIVRAFKGPNNKYINSAFNAIASTFSLTTPYSVLLNGVAQGTTENTRIGRLAKMRWVDIDFSIYQNATFDASDVRIYVVAESTALGSAISAAQFFVDATQFSSTSQRDRTNRNASRYVVLWDSGPLTIGPTSLASGQTAPAVIGAGQPTSIARSLHLPLGFSTDYSRGNAGNVGDIDTNSLHLLCVTDQTTAASVGIVGGWTLCFNDDS